MLERCLIRAVLLAVLAVVLLVASAGPAVAALDCNSDLTINLPAGTLPPGGTVPVTLIVSNGPSTDVFDQPVVQSFDAITLWPSCTSVLPCVVDASLPVAFIGPVSTDCSVDHPWTTSPLSGATEIEFTFTGGIGPDPNALTLPAATGLVPITSCQLVFYVSIDASFTGSIRMEASTSGVCDPSGLALGSSSVATATITVAPLPPQLVVEGVIESTDGGFRFPDGSLQLTAYGGASSLASVVNLDGARTLVSGACAVGSSIGAINADGTVTCEAIDADIGDHAAVAEAHHARNPDPPCFNMTQRFVDCGNGTVTDTVTGLIYLKNADCFGAQTWPAANRSAMTLAAGQCSLTDGSVAGDWRLQTQEEWEVLLESSCPMAPKIAGDGVSGTCYTDSSWASGVASADYWSSSTNIDSPGSAWNLNLVSGTADPDLKTTTSRVWPVRGGQ